MQRIEARDYTGELAKHGKAKKLGGMGFRCLIMEFNIALFGKQAWRLITRHESLVAIIYTARYYPKIEFTSAKVGGNPSYKEAFLKHRK